MMLTAIVVGFSLLASSLAATNEWHYGNSQTGESSWKYDFPQCGGNNQSPIDITGNIQQDTTIPDFEYIGYESSSEAMTITNNGHTVQISIDNPGAIRIRGGGLSEDYILGQVHFHWGNDETRGSEHTFSSVHYPLEAHFVHYKSSSGSIAGALNTTDGLAVLGFMFALSDYNNTDLDGLVEKLNLVKYKGESATYTGTSMNKLKPIDHTKFYRYQGSLTTPTCNEAVIWTVFEEKTIISKTQFQQFNSLYKTRRNQYKSFLTNNYRDVQPLNQRTIRKNFQAADYKWGYDGPSAARYWPVYYGTCNGQEQSPINLDDSTVTVNTSLEFLNTTNYGENMTMTITNNGHTIQININSDHYLDKGGLNSKYKAHQLHFHWGKSSSMGSEHTRNGKHYPMEMHVVHWREDYSTFSDSTTYRDGLAVLGAFFEIKDEDNPKLATIISKLPDVHYKGAEVELSGFSLNDLLFDNLEEHPFFRYMGGLTTPPCLEVVVWTVLMAKIPISERQLAAFREILEDTEAQYDHTNPHYVVQNYRPVQSVQTRIVYTNYPFTTDTSGASFIQASIYTAFIIALISHVIKL